MKKITLSLSLLIALTFTFSSCSKDEDTESPVITLNGDNPDYTVLKFTYIDPGATATDNNDDNVTVSTSNLVNSNAANGYTITYSATDEAGNPSQEIRDVWVVDLTGTYSANDACTGSAATSYTETITTTTAAINFSKFANYINGAVNGTISGDNESGFTINIPSQIVSCGNPAANRTFSGTGSIEFSVSGSNVVSTITIDYTEVTNGTSVSCTDTYVK